jgi:protein-tyrosine kinase
MERIERALEVARLHRHRLTEAAPAPGAATMTMTPPAASFAEAMAEEHVMPRIDEAPLAQIASREQLRERYVVFPDEPGPASLSYKMLRTQVLQRARQHSMRCIGVVSAASGEGKTVTAINLSLSLAAESNQSVILADLDFKRPTIARTLGLECESGLESFFTRAATIESLWRRFDGIPRLAVLPTMAPLAASSELLAGAAGAELLKNLRNVSGESLVIADLPPALLSDDVLAIAPSLDGVVIVVTEERTRREDLQRVFELLRSTPVIGTVLNASADAEARTY